MARPSFNFPESLRWPPILTTLVLILSLAPGGSAAGVTEPSAFIYPVDHGTNLDPSRPIRWEVREGALAYYLYIGTVPGAKDLVDTGETQSTEFQSTTLPVARTLYATIWTKFASGWKQVAISFSYAPVALLTVPSDGVIRNGRVEWTKVEGTQAYYLYVGRTEGAKDLINTGETLETSWSVGSISGGQVVHARLWTRHGGQWRYVDRSLTVLSSAVPTPAVFVYPEDGEDVSPGSTLEWTTVVGAQAYYLYVGTTPGAKDLIDTGETLKTSWSLGTIPGGQTVYARLWTRAEGQWRYVDRPLTIRAERADFVQPEEGAEVASGSTVTWTTVVGAQAYYLYVGTTPGAKDLIDTGETLKTSWSLGTIPGGQTVYARLWTRLSGQWRYVERSLVMTPLAWFLRPLSGEHADPAGSVEWSAVVGAQAYYLYVGSGPGQKNLLDTGETLETSWPLSAVPARGQTVYARLFTKHGGAWRFVDRSFAMAPIASIVRPDAGVTDVDLAPLEVSWTPVDGADGYRLWVGSSPEAIDLFDSGETQSERVSIPALEGGRPLYLRLGTRIGAHWTFSEISITGRAAASFIYPELGEAGVDGGHPFEWSSVAGAQEYRLEVGSEPGGFDILQSGSTLAQSLSVPPIPAMSVVYARIWTRKDGIWRYNDTIFTTGPREAAQVVEPASSAIAFDAGRGFRWTRVPAGSYRLLLGTSPGAHDLHDSGEIRLTRRYVEELPLDRVLHGTLITTFLDGERQDVSFAFTLASAQITAADRFAAAAWATAEVRKMASTANIPYLNTPLRDYVQVGGRPSAYCSDYAAVLRQLLQETDPGIVSRRLDVALNPNGYDVHTLTEVYDQATGRWILFDPTFGLLVRRGVDDTPASAVDVALAARRERWSDIRFEAVTESGYLYANGYYLDYPLLFVNILSPGAAAGLQQVESILQYYTQSGADRVSLGGLYALRCLDGSTTAQAVISGQAISLPCTPGIDAISRLFFATEITPQTGFEGQFEVLSPRRYVFNPSSLSESSQILASAPRLDAGESRAGGRECPAEAIQE